eukprot:TRINITY_DN29070_c0_g1_i1.p1 TRINITY_DN29070_c0_g1~~TRINITY_DN29070_c0_g1_i1.p1  ORF type:complete len:209 (-),score=40.28 TRINITY_DN29070_c0_g1_i1:52-639(-)
MDEHVELYKIVIVGDGGVGKSAITIQLTQSHFITEYDPTIENTYRKPLHVDGEMCMLDILDTAGQEEYSAMRDQYFRTGNGFVIVFSVVDRTSFDAIPGYRTAILRVKQATSYPMVICANKIDLVNDRVVSADEVAALGKTCQSSILETSAKLRQNIDEAFFQVVREIKQFRNKKGGKEGGSDPYGRKKSKCSIL